MSESPEASFWRKLGKKDKKKDKNNFQKQVRLGNKSSKTQLDENLRRKQMIQGQHIMAKNYNDYWVGGKVFIEKR